MPLESLLIYRFILPLLSFIQAIHLLKKLGHLSYRISYSLDSAAIISPVYVSLFPVFSTD